MTDLQETIKNAPTDLLCRAARTLQEAHEELATRDDVPAETLA